MDKDLAAYCIKYPGLCVDIWNFFHNDSVPSMHQDLLKQRLGNGVVAKSAKSPLDFSQAYTKYKTLDDRFPIQPITVDAICKKFCDYNMLEKVNVAGINIVGTDGGFYWGMKKNQLPQEFKVQRYLNSKICGFKYVYEVNKNMVLPIYVKKRGKGNQSVGTCFISDKGIVTAKHCLEKYDCAQIPGLSMELLNNSMILCHDKYDLLLIVPQDGGTLVQDGLWFGSGEILDETLSMGYPKHAGFENFLTATTGQIAGIHESYIYKHKLMLLTGKIKGGNSGGPVFNDNGCVVGVITETPDPDGDYDKFGYGVAIPIEYIDLLRDKFEHGVKFVDDIDSVND